MTNNPTCAEELWDLLQEQRDAWQEEEEKEAEGDTSLSSRGVVAGSRTEDGNLVSEAEKGPKKKKQKNRPVGHQDGK